MRGADLPAADSIRLLLLAMQDGSWRVRKATVDEDRTVTGFNIAGDGSCNLNGPGDMNDTDPLLGSLSYHGGPTRTYLPLEGSPVIDAGDNISCPATDQRGFRRPGDGDGDGLEICDIGSVEFYPWFVQLPIVFR